MERIGQNVAIKVEAELTFGGVPATGLTVSVQISKDGAAYAANAAASNWVEIGGGSYYAELSEDDTDTVGLLNVLADDGGITVDRKVVHKRVVDFSAEALGLLNYAPAGLDPMSAFGDVTITNAGRGVRKLTQAQAYRVALSQPTHAYAGSDVSFYLEFHAPVVADPINTSIGFAAANVTKNQFLGFDTKGLGIYYDGTVFDSSGTIGTVEQGYPDGRDAVVIWLSAGGAGLLWVKRLSGMASGNWNNDPAADPDTLTGGIDISGFINGLVTGEFNLHAAIQLYDDTDRIRIYQSDAEFTGSRPASAQPWANSYGQEEQRVGISNIAAAVWALNLNDAGYTGSGLEAANILMNQYNLMQALPNPFPTAIQAADALLDRDMAAGTDSGSDTVRTVRQALRMNRNRIERSATRLDVYKEDDTTISHSSDLTTSASVNPIVSVNPDGP